LFTASVKISAHRRRPHDFLLELDELNCGERGTEMFRISRTGEYSETRIVQFGSYVHSDADGMQPEGRQMPLPFRHFGNRW
jgi:hypothetical protein